MNISETKREKKVDRSVTIEGGKGALDSPFSLTE